MSIPVRSIMHKATAVNEDMTVAEVAKMKVREIMSSPLITISADEPVDNASLLMARHGIRRLPVVEGDKIIGIVTTRDVANSLRWFISPRR